MIAPRRTSLTNRLMFRRAVFFFINCVFAESYSRKTDNWSIQNVFSSGFQRTRAQQRSIAFKPHRRLIDAHTRTRRNHTHLFIRIVNRYRNKR